MDNLEPYWHFVHTAKKAHYMANRFGRGLGFRVAGLELRVWVERLLQ